MAENSVDVNSLSLSESGATVMEKSNKIVSAVKRLSNENTLELSTNCDKLQNAFMQQEQKLLYTRNEKKKTRDLKSEYTRKISDYLQQELNLSTINRTSQHWKEEFSDLPLYYMLRSSVPNEHIKNIIMRLYDPLNFSLTWENYCFNVVQEEFQHYRKRFEGKFEALKGLLLANKRVFLNMNPKAIILVKLLIENFKYTEVLDILTNIEEDGQTRMFYMQYDEEIQLYVKLFQGQLDDMYKLLMIKDHQGFTALHLKPHVVSKLLIETYTYQSKELFLKLSSITVKHKHKIETVKTLSNLRHHREDFIKLENAVKTSYIISQRPTILIIYNTKGRPGAKAEATCIHEACCSKFNYHGIRLEEDKPAKRIKELIKDAAKKTESALIVILMSHGRAGAILDCENQEMKLSDIESQMCTEPLKHIPKVLITQCCQTRKLGKEPSPYVPTHDHFCAFMSSIEGDPSERKNFIYKLSDQIRKSGQDTDIFKIAVTVTNLMKNEQNSKESKGCDESSNNEKSNSIPIIMSTLRAELRPADDTWWWRFF